MTRDTAKLIARNVVAFSSSFTIANVISANAKPKNRLQQAEVWIGSTAAGMIFADVAAKKTDRVIDAIYNVIEGKQEPNVVVLH